MQIYEMNGNRQPDAIAEGLKPKELAVALAYSLRKAYYRYRPRSGKVDPRLLTPEDKQRLNEYRFKKAAEAARPLSPHEAPAPESSGQLRLLPKTEEDLRLKEQLSRLHPAQVPAVLARFRAIMPLVNHDYKAMGHPTKDSYIREMAGQNRVSQATIWRWYRRYLEAHDVCALANEQPGPKARGFGADALDASMRAHLFECWAIKKLTRAQSTASLIGYLKDKQRGCGASWIYWPPSKETVRRYINVELRGDENPWRLGRDELKAWAGYNDRTYRSLSSLGQVECDEHRLNVLGFEPRHANRVQRFWLVTIFDTRSIYPLVWDLVGAADGATKLHGITQRDEQRLFVRLATEYGVPGKFYSDRGRFRGSFWGGEPGASANRRDKEFARSDGILDSLGIERSMPREKNPRGSRLERFHRFASDKCRGVPGWVGANTKERKMAPGDRHAAEHAEWIAGRRDATPLLTKDQILERINAWMEEWREHASDGTDMDGLSPRRVFLDNTPRGGFRQLDATELALLQAERFTNLKVYKGGIIQLPDGLRYGCEGELTELQGTNRNIARFPDDKSFITVMGLRKGESEIVAHLRPRLGMDDPRLGDAMEGQRRLLNAAESRLEEPSPASNTAEILEPYRTSRPAPRRPRFADDVARDLLKREDSDASAS